MVEGPFEALNDHKYLGFNSINRFKVALLYIQAGGGGVVGGGEQLGADSNGISMARSLSRTNFYRIGCVLLRL